MFCRIKPLALLLAPDHASLIADEAVTNSAVDGRPHRLPHAVGYADEAQVAGQGMDDVFALVGRALSPDRPKRLAQLIEVVVSHGTRPGADERGTVGLDDPSA